MTGRPPTKKRAIRGRIRLAFGRPATTDADTPVLPPAAPIVPEIHMIAYAADCVLSGHVRLSAERLSDLLNDNEEFELIDVMVSDLEGSHAVELRNVVVHRDELLLVQASGPRGNAQRRQRTRQHPIVAKTGPYEVRGYIHAIPGSDPIASLRRRKPMVAMTDAVIEYTIGRTRHERRAGVVILNRECLDWVVEGVDEEVASVDIPAGEAGPLLKDFTGELLG
jgi:hypothetical protein